MVEILKREVAYKGYSIIEKVTVRLDDGEEMTREVESHGRAVGVLPYDPIRKMALLVRQFRAPAKLSCGADAVLEACAGMIDGEDQVEETVRREALEELGVTLGPLSFVATAWPSCGVSTETMSLYLAEYAPSDRVAPGGGLADEQENISVEESSLAELAHLGADGTAVDMKLLVLVQALKLKRPDLFG
jgi:nudix-type nucleoside diphosphatase (YffH/AdpP family)